MKLSLDCPQVNIIVREGAKMWPTCTAVTDGNSALFVVGQRRER